MKGGGGKGGGGRPGKAQIEVEGKVFSLYHFIQIGKGKGGEFEELLKGGRGGKGRMVYIIKKTSRRSEVKGTVPANCKDVSPLSYKKKTKRGRKKKGPGSAEREANPPSVEKITARAWQRTKREGRKIKDACLGERGKGLPFTLLPLQERKGDREQESVGKKRKK